jgi:hypothetical protein
MNKLVICASVVIVLALLHYSYLDWRARARGGVLWFWTAWEKPMLLRISNLAVLAALATALASFVIGVNELIVLAIAALFILHVVTMEMMLKHAES